MLRKFKIICKYEEKFVNKRMIEKYIKVDFFKLKYFKQFSACFIKTFLRW